MAVSFGPITCHQTDFHTIILDPLEIFQWNLLQRLILFWSDIYVTKWKVKVTDSITRKKSISMQKDQIECIQ